MDDNAGRRGPAGSDRADRDNRAEETGRTDSGSRRDRGAAMARAWRTARVNARRRLCALVLRPGALALLVLFSATALAATLATSAAT